MLIVLTLFLKLNFQSSVFASLFFLRGNLRYKMLALLVFQSFTKNFTTFFLRVLHFRIREGFSIVFFICFISLFSHTFLLQLKLTDLQRAQAWLWDNVFIFVCFHALSHGPSKKKNTFTARSNKKFIRPLSFGGICVRQIKT